MRIFFNVLIAVFVLSMLGCGSASTDQGTDAASTESKSKSLTKEKIPMAQTTYSITDTSAGEFYPGAVLPLWEGANTEYKLDKRIEKKQQEGEIFEEVQYNASINGEHLLTLIPHFDIRVEEYNEIVSEVIVISNKYADSKGIQVGSSVSDFKKAYPDAKCFVTYISQRCWLSAGDNGPQYELPIPSNIPDHSDLVEVPLSEVNDNQKIQSIRIFQSGSELRGE